MPYFLLPSNSIPFTIYYIIGTADIQIFTDAKSKSVSHGAVKRSATANARVMN